MNIKPYIIKKIVYPVVERKNSSKTLEYLKEYEKSQYLSKDEILSLQWNRLKKLLAYSYDNCPFYKSRLKALGIVPSDIHSPSDLLSFPILTKEDIQLNIDKMLDPKISKSKLIEDYTGGSTGKPLKFYYDKQRSQRREASRIRHNRWCGWDIGEKIAILWGAASDNEGYAVRRKIRNLILSRAAFLDSFDLTVEKMETYRNYLEKFKPVTILAYANSIYLFAKFLQNKQHSIFPEGIITSAETLTEEKRSIVESTFRCKVFDRYGSREIGLLASECEKHSGLHINAENVYIEIVKGNGLAADGEIGKVIVTDLLNYAMPLIRYEIGDMAIATSATCTCGRGLPLIKSIEGRGSDFIIAPSGKLIHGEYFTHLFYGEDSVQQFQLVQETMDTLVLQIVPSRRYSELNIVNIVRKIQNYVGDDVKIEIKKVNEITKTPSGKYRFTISKIPLPF